MNGFESLPSGRRTDEPMMSTWRTCGILWHPIWALTGVSARDISNCSRQLDRWDEHTRHCIRIPVIPLCVSLPLSQLVLSREGVLMLVLTKGLPALQCYIWNWGMWTESNRSWQQRMIKHMSEQTYNLNIPLEPRCHWKPLVEQCCLCVR